MAKNGIYNTNTSTCTHTHFLCLSLAPCEKYRGERKNFQQLISEVRDSLPTYCYTIIKGRHPYLFCHAYRQMSFFISKGVYNFSLIRFLCWNLLSRFSSKITNIKKKLELKINEGWNLSSRQLTFLVSRGTLLFSTKKATLI